MLIKLTDKILQGFRWVLKRYVSKSNELNNSELVMFQDMLRGEGGHLVTWSGEAEGTLSPLWSPDITVTPSAKVWKYRNQCFQRFFPSTWTFNLEKELSILGDRSLFIGGGKGGGGRILEGITWFLGEYKWESVVTENPKGRIAKKIGRIRKGDQLNLLGKWGHGAAGDHFSEVTFKVVVD